MKLGLITYQAPHLKTTQIVEGLVAKGCRDMTIYAMPLKTYAPRQPLFAHRPGQFVGDHVKDLAARNGLNYVEVSTDADIPGGRDVYLVTGANILSAACVTGKAILNIHPGVIPLVRGLDAFKWGILDDQPMGNTLHYIDAEVDMGEVVSIVPTPVYPDDTLATLAARHYDREIEMLVEFEQHLAKRDNPFAGAEARPSRMRMPAEQEQQMLDHFEDYKRRFATPKAA